MARKLLTVSHIPLWPLNAGNRIRILHMLDQLADLDIEVHFLHIQKMSFDREAMQAFFGDRYHEIPFPPTSEPTPLTWWQRIRQVFQPEPFKYNSAIDDWYSDSLHKELCALQEQHKFDIVLAQYVFFSRILTCFSQDVLKVIDTHDRFGHRYRMFQEHGIKPAWLSAFPRDEIRCLNRADKVIAIQAADARYFKKSLGNKVVTIGHTTPIKSVPTPLDPHRLLLVGGINAVNLDALRFCLDEILPLVCLRYPQTQLFVVGDLAQRAEDQPSVVKVGHVESLDEAYALARVVINPCRFGTGLKTKNVEAMGYGRALITTPAGAEGIESAAGKALVIVDTAAAFAAAICSLFADASASDKLGRGGQEYVANWNKQQQAALRATFLPT